ncbi:hypothetical protein SAMN03159475_0132 [Pseudomonas sp. NFPP33]|nr:hypothetical protein [Pseudomonas sp. NFPP33]AGH89260.1 hypothetical protein [uncultured bacterium]SDA85462.1 hypothetical protein SAMN03159475_0132 [Pseudomonas sp. NFPP33]
MLQYHIYVNGEEQGHLSADEYNSIRKEVRSDYRNWIAAILGELSVFPIIFGHLVKGLTVVGAIGFIFLLIYAPHVAGDFVGATPLEIADALRGYGKLLATVAVMGTVLVTTVIGFFRFVEPKPSAFDIALIEKVRVMRGFNRFSTVALDAVTLPVIADQEQN